MTAAAASQGAAMNKLDAAMKALADLADLLDQDASRAAAMSQDAQAQYAMGQAAGLRQACAVMRNAQA